MNCVHIKELLTDYLNQELSQAERIQFEAHLAVCPDCQVELELNLAMLKFFEEQPVPPADPQVLLAFDKMLSNYGQRKKESIWLKIRRNITVLKWPLSSRTLAFGFSMICTGLILGFILFKGQRPENSKSEEITALSLKIEQMQQTMLLTLLDNELATQRLRGVSYTKSLTNVKDPVVTALLTTLNNDPNVNVRIATLEALVQLGDNAKVREGLVRSLTQQESPLVQIALADAMVRLHEKRSIKIYEKMIHKESLNQIVKTKLNQTIKDLS